MNAFHSWHSAADRAALDALLRDAGLGEGKTGNRHVKDLDAVGLYKLKCS